GWRRRSLSGWPPPGRRSGTGRGATTGRCARSRTTWPTSAGTPTSSATCRPGPAAGPPSALSRAHRLDGVDHVERGALDVLPELRVQLGRQVRLVQAGPEVGQPALPGLVGDLERRVPHAQPGVTPLL